MNETIGHRLDSWSPETEPSGPSHTDCKSNDLGMAMRPNLTVTPSMGIFPAWDIYVHLLPLKQKLLN